MLFLFCINNLASSLTDDAIIALFPDNVSILTAACKKEDVKVAVQSVVNYMLIWSQEWKLNLKADKTEVYLFQLGLMAALVNLPSILVLQNSGQRHSTSSQGHSGQEPYVQCRFEETNYIPIIQSPYHQSHSKDFLGLASFNSENYLSCTLHH